MASASSSLPWIASKTVFLAGGGISSLAFTIALQRQWTKHGFPANSFPRITILERDTPTSRIGREGYTLSLRTDGGHGGGVRVLDDLGLYQTCVSHAAAFGQGDMYMWDGREVARANGKEDWPVLVRVTHARASGQKGAREGLRHMRLRRSELVRILTEEALRVPDVRMVWDSEVVGVRREKERVIVVAKDGQEHEGDLLVAGDGSKSKVRQALRPELGLDFAKLSMIAATSRWSRKEDVPRPFEKDWGLVMYGSGVASFIAPVDETSVVWSVAWLSDKMIEERKAPWQDGEADRVLEQARETAAAAGPKMMKLINASDPSTLMMFNARDRPPFAHDIDEHGPVIWMGDANHAVSPYAGNGANMALLDGWELAESLCDNTSLQDGVKAFDRKFHPRTQAVLKESHRNISIGHSTGWTFYAYSLLFRILNMLFG